MSNQTNGPRDIVEGGPERTPDGQEPEQTGRRGAAQKQPGGGDKDRKDAPQQHRDDVSYQPESGQPGAD